MLSQKFWDGDLPDLFGLETAACLTQLGTALSALFFHQSGEGRSGQGEAQTLQRPHAPESRA